MTDENKELNLIQKIASVQAGFGEVAKEGHNRIQNYDYVTEAQVKKLIRQPLAKLGVIINPQFEIKNEWNETTKKGGIMHYASVLGIFELTDGNSTIKGQMPGTGMDTGDKAIYKAETGAQKNYLMQLFMLSTGDDPEQEESKQYQGNNYKSNNYSNNRNTNYQSRNNQQYVNNRQPSKLSDQVINQKKFDQILLMINQVANLWGMDKQSVYDQIKKEYPFKTLNNIPNRIADQIIIYLSNALKSTKVQSNGSNRN